MHKLIEEPRTAAAAANPVIYGQLPVNIVASNADRREFRLIEPTVTVVVTGPADLIGKLQANQIHATVDLTQTSTVNSARQPVAVAVPPGVTVVSIKPDSIGVIPPPPKH